MLMGFKPNWDTEINYSTDDAWSNTYSASKSLLPVLLPDKAVVAPSSKPAEENDIWVYY
jgi:hypothetical protein